MCFMKTPKPIAPTPIIAGTDTNEAAMAADVEARLRRRRAGAAAHVLTSPTGIPATTKLGVPS